jgi:hypothetical protein
MISELTFGAQAYLLLVSGAFTIFILALAYGWLKTNKLGAWTPETTETPRRKPTSQAPPPRRAA